MTKDIGLGIIGLAAGEDLLDINRDFDSRLRVVALCDSNARAARDMADRHQIPFITTDPVDLLSQPGVDAVAVCGPLADRFEHCMAAVASGKRVLCGVPFAHTLRDAETLARELAAGGGSLMAANPYRWYPDLAATRELAARGDLGDLHIVEARAALPLDADRVDAWGLAVPLDLLRWVGGEVESVMAVANGGAATATVRCASGALGRALAVRTPAALNQCHVSLSVYGSDGAVVEGRVALNRLPGLPAMTFALDSGRSERLGSVRAFEASLDDAAGVPDLLDGIKTVALCAAVDESIRTGAPAVVPSTSP